MRLLPRRLLASCKWFCLVRSHPASDPTPCAPHTVHSQISATVIALIGEIVGSENILPRRRRQRSNAACRCESSPVFAQAERRRKQPKATFFLLKCLVPLGKFDVGGYREPASQDRSMRLRRTDLIQHFILCPRLPIRVQSERATLGRIFVPRIPQSFGIRKPRLWSVPSPSRHENT